MKAGQRAARRTVRWVVVLIVLLAVGVVITTVVMSRGESDGPGGGAAGTQSGAEGASASDGGDSGDPSDAVGSPTAEGEPTEPPRVIGFDTQQPRPTESPAPAPVPSGGPGIELEPVAPEVVVEVPSGAVVSLARIEAVHGQAIAGGEISGPAVRVFVEIQNNDVEPIDLEYVVVNAYYGANRTPAGSIMKPGGKPFIGSLPPGESAEGVYLFSIGESDRGDVEITVDYGIGEPIVVFRGDLT